MLIMVTPSCRKLPDNLGVFLDFRRAFDFAEHNILLDLLLYCGIGELHRNKGKSNVKISYLHMQIQLTFLYGQQSPKVKLSCSAPQRSSLSLLLFLIYIHNIVNIPLTSDIVSYAGGIFFPGKPLDDPVKVSNA